MNMKKIVFLVALYCSATLAEDGVEVTLDATIVGNQEQPKVIYIVPWQAPDGPEGFEQHFNLERDALYEPVERDEFRRHLGILQQLDSAE